MVVTSQWASFNQSSKKHQPTLVLGARYGLPPDHPLTGYDYYYGYDYESANDYEVADKVYVGPPPNMTLTSLGIASVGPRGTGCVNFQAESLEFLEGGTRRIQLHASANSNSSSSSAGLTIVAVVRFAGCEGLCGDGLRGPKAPMDNEGLVHLGSGPDGNDFVYLSRDGSSSRMVFAIGIASSASGDHVSCSIVSDNGTIVPGEWMTVVARYSAVTNSVDLLKDGRYPTEA